MKFQILIACSVVALAAAHDHLSGCVGEKADISDFQRTSPKFQAFRDNCPRDASLTTIFGVGSSTSDKLTANGLNKAIDVVEAYVAVGCDREAFIDRLVSFDINSGGANTIFISIDHHVKTVGPRCSRDCTGSRVPLEAEQAMSGKFLRFRNSCAGSKSTDSIFGIGSSSARTLLASTNIDTAAQIVEEFVNLRCNQQQFVDWLVAAGLQRDAATFASISVDHYYKVRGPQCSPNCLSAKAVLTEEQVLSRRFQSFRDNCPVENQSTRTVFGIGSSSRDKLSENGISSADQLVTTYFNLGCTRETFVNLLVSYGMEEQAANFAFNSVDHHYKTRGPRCSIACTRAPVEIEDPTQAESEKFQSFRDNCAANQATNAIFGIGSSSARNLSDNGFDKAEQLVDEFVGLGCSTEQFSELLVTYGMQQQAAGLAAVTLDHYFKARGPQCKPNCINEPVAILPEQANSQRFQSFRDNCQANNQSARTIFGIGRSSTDKLDINGLQSATAVVKAYLNFSCSRVDFVDFLVGFNLEEQAANFAFNSVDHFFKARGPQCLNL